MKQLSTAACAAKLIRQELKNAFPHIKFRVKSETYSMGNSVWVYWENGITIQEVNKIIDKYQKGHFNGMEDIYEYSNVNENLPQVKHTFCERTITENFYNQAFEYVRYSWKCFKNIKDIDEGSEEIRSTHTCWTARNWLYRLLYKIDLSHGLTKESLENVIFGQGA